MAQRLNTSSRRHSAGGRASAHGNQPLDAAHDPTGWRDTRVVAAVRSYRPVRLSAARRRRTCTETRRQGAGCHGTARTLRRSPEQTSCTRRAVAITSVAAAVAQGLHKSRPSGVFISQAPAIIPSIASRVCRAHTASTVTRHVCDEVATVSARARQDKEGGARALC